jgi:hypothetical protein
MAMLDRDKAPLENERERWGRQVGLPAVTTTAEHWPGPMLR